MAVCWWRDLAQPFRVGRYIALLCLFQHSGINSSNAEVLALFNVTEADAGEYICKVSNYIGQANQSAWLTVLPKQQGNNVFVCLFFFGFFFKRRLDIEAEKTWCFGRLQAAYRVILWSWYIHHNLSSVMQLVGCQQPWKNTHTCSKRLLSFLLKIALRPPPSFEVVPSGFSCSGCTSPIIVAHQHCCRHTPVCLLRVAFA